MSRGPHAGSPVSGSREGRVEAGGLHSFGMTTPATGLVLTGGGARAAYQVGVLKAIARIRRHCDAPRANPFPVITGTSAGAINAVALACHADRFDLAVAGLVEVWRGFRSEQVYRADMKKLPDNGWSLYGLADSLRKQGKADEAQAVDAKFKEVWSKSDIKIKSSCLCKDGVTMAE